MSMYIYIYQWQDEITVAEMGLFRNLPDLETVDRGLVGCQLSAIDAWLSWSGDVAMCHASVATPKRYPGCQWSCKQRLNGSWVFLWSQVTGHRFIRTSLYSSHVPSQFVNHDPQPTSLNVPIRQVWRSLPATAILCFPSTAEVALEGLEKFVGRCVTWIWIKGLSCWGLEPWWFGPRPRFELRSA